MKHYGEYLAWAGRPIEWESSDIAMKMNERERLKKQIKAHEAEIVKMEMD